MNASMNSIIVALDVNTTSSVDQLLDQLSQTDDRPAVKVGMELFYSEGAAMIRHIQQRGFDIFLDLKLHDIPNTVERAAYQLGQLGIQYTTVHALGGKAMIAAAKRGLQQGAQQAHVTPPKLLAVTELTSISEKMLVNEQHVSLPMTDQVRQLAQLAEAAGADGVICSPQEVTTIKPFVNDNFLLVTPGIRLTTNPADDQQRVMTPRQAAEAGSSAIVVGRPITQSNQPADAYMTIKKEWLIHD
ncbi:orotidine-5'-phosphate decarboxylase [Furfurilactobacillus milii]|uniref:Orotidine 5'-phosphate decarboxylase n=2 Tax=Furfurilactobacillus milii TaxID=2888272 RepID=A0ABT6DFF3_9LACO|nr:orotidine-5'-phosphate decarboxylase [Furfurilactobacillus milii]QLE67728.1 Orotidine 5'-phosphate decarboxylase [Furfurilactobacillus rossiae]MCF6160421.1 orotidine-5'-phosphate decarboxylase [Furfurilactobacillus milii]MCF6162653.1 orotidine-5'-phosphate decarboxylase [Furfurilactobacillus milii]MCF6418339.1 orotidine-5'-phosphate decarboxylase [Furfurilactobacillus milii]MDF9914081.1 orotidine-5'-phosphate decarboxylase [Furfurilactobacillus milii]